MAQVAEEFSRFDKSSSEQNQRKVLNDALERFRSDLLNSISTSLENFSSNVNRIETNEDVLFETNDEQVDKKFPTKVFKSRPSILTNLLKSPHIRSIRQVFISILVLLVLQVGFTDFFERGTVDFRFEIIRWNFSNVFSCFRVWICLFLSTNIVVYYSFHFWSYQRLSFLSTEKDRKTKSLILFDGFSLIFYLVYVVLFFYFPVDLIIKENYPIATRIIVLIEQIRFLMKSHAFVRENVPRAVLYGHNQIFYPVSLDENEISPSSPCPEFSKFFYFIFAPTLIYRDEYPQSSSIRWSYVFNQLSQSIASFLFSFYIYDRFCFPVFSKFNSKHFTAEMFVLSILNCTLPGALLLFCAFYGFLHCWLNAFAEIFYFDDRQFYGEWWTARTWRSFYRRWNIVVHDWLHVYIFQDLAKIFGVKYQFASFFTVIVISAGVHEYILSISFGYFYPILFVQFAIFGCIALLILPKSPKNSAYNVFIWTSLFIGLGMQMCLYSMEWYARQNCPRTLDTSLDYFIPRSFFCRDNEHNVSESS